MAANGNKDLVQGTWTELTSANVTNITFQNLGNSRILVKATVGAVTPSSGDGAIRYERGEGEVNIALSDLFPGVTGANRLYAISDDRGIAFVSHA